MSTPPPTGHCWDAVIGPEERLVATLYDRERVLGSRPALILVDCYEKAFGGGPLPLAEAIVEHPSSCGQAAWEALPHVEALLLGARAARIPIIHTTVDPGDVGSVTRRRVRAGGGDRTFGTEFVRELEPVPGEIILTKSRASAFFGTPLSTWLRQLDRDTVLVAGQSTSGCVRATAVDAFSHGFHVGVVEEACFDRSPLSHRMSLFDLGLKYATVQHVDDSLTFLHTLGG